MLLVGAKLLLYLLICYTIGSVPFGYMIARALGRDVTREGSKNIGATNVARVLGLGPGALVLVLDALKGYLAVYIGRMFFSSQSQLASFDCQIFLFLGAYAAVFGHSYSIFLRFYGGKGVATSLGAVLALFPYQTLIGVLSFALIVLLTRVVSIASLLASVLVAFLVFIDFKNNLPAIFFVFLTLALIFYRHRSNIERIFSGTENVFRMGGKK